MAELKEDEHHYKGDGGWKEFLSNLTILAKMAKIMTVSLLPDFASFNPSMDRRTMGEWMRFFAVVVFLSTSYHKRTEIRKKIKNPHPQSG